MRDILKNTIRKTQKIATFRYIGRFIQRNILHIFLIYLKRCDDVLSVYAKGGMARGDFIFGESDIDIIAIIKSSDPKSEFETLMRLRKAALRFNSFFGGRKVINFVYFFSERDLDFLPKIGKKLFLIDTSNWKHLSGQRSSVDLLNKNYSPDAMLSALNYTDIWWLTLSRKYLSSKDIREGGLRNFYSVAFKLCRGLVYAQQIHKKEDLLTENNYAFIEKISSPCLKKWCNVIRTSQTPDFSSDIDEETAEVLSMSLQWFDVLCHEYLKESKNQKPVSWILSNATLKGIKESIPKNTTEEIVQFSSVLYKNMKAHVHSILSTDKSFIVIVNDGIPPEELKLFFQNLRGFFNDSKIALIDQKNVFVWTRSIFRLIFSGDPIKYFPFQIYTHVLQGPPLTHLLENIDQSSCNQRLVNFAYSVMDSKKIPLERGIEALVKQQNTLINLMLNRILFEKNVVPLHSSSGEEYAAFYPHEEMTPKIVSLSTTAWETKDLDLEQLISVSSQLYASIEYLSKCIQSILFP